MRTAVRPRVLELFAIGVMACLWILPWRVAAGAPEDGVIVVSDYVPPSKVRVLDAATKSVVFDYRLRQDGPAVCRQSDVFCGTLGFYHTTHRGDDYLDVAITVVNPLGGSAVDDFYSLIQRVRVGDPVREVWRVRRLDFSDVPGGEAYCREFSGGAPLEADPRCQILFAHAFQVIDDRPEEQVVTVVVADTLNKRVVQVTLDYNGGNTVGHVDWVLGKTHPAWYPMSLPNSVQVIDDPDGRYLLVTIYSESFRPLGGGMLQMYRWEDGDWTEMWRFPDPNAGDAPFLNTPHRAEVLLDPVSGERRIWYSHSRGLAADWHEMAPRAFGATWGILVPGASLSEPPVYLLDAAPFLEGDDQPVTFTRDQAYLPDGSVLLADSACESLCRYTPRILRVDRFFEGVRPSEGKTGCYTKDHEELNLIDIPEDAVQDIYACGFHGIFEAEWIPAGELGAQLAQARATPGMRCPDW